MFQFNLEEQHTTTIDKDFSPLTVVMDLLKVMMLILSDATWKKKEFINSGLFIPSKQYHRQSQRSADNA